ncbi:MAG: hypothetical protein GY722_01925 [bacterium]|nr:hypothetical protein [bacterium]
MTSDELRRLANQRVATADALGADAARLRSQAAELVGILNPLLPMSRRVWVGPAAEDFESTVRANTVILDQEAQRLCDIAGGLERRARFARGEAAELRARAAAIQVVTAVGPGVV